MHGAKRNLCAGTIGHVRIGQGHHFTRAFFSGGGGIERHRLLQAHGGLETYRSGQDAIHVASRGNEGLQAADLEMFANVAFDVCSGDLRKTQVQVSDVSVGSSFLPFVLQELAPVREDGQNQTHAPCLS
jgi:hypothetical protein